MRASQCCCLGKGSDRGASTTAAPKDVEPQHGFSSFRNELSVKATDRINTLCCSAHYWKQQEQVVMFTHCGRRHRRRRHHHLLVSWSSFQLASPKPPSPLPDSTSYAVAAVFQEKLTETHGGTSELQTPWDHSGLNKIP